MKKEYYTDANHPIYTKSDLNKQKNPCHQCKQKENLFIEYKKKLICIKCFEKLPGEVII
jgi:hypothetical protein